MSVQNLGQFAMMIFHSVTFVNNLILPFDLGEDRFVLDDIFVRCYKDIEPRSTDKISQNSASIWRT